MNFHAAATLFAHDAKNQPLALNRKNHAGNVRDAFTTTNTKIMDNLSYVYFDSIM